MRSLFWFELKKMLGRRLAVAVNVGVVALIVGVMALNVVQCKTTDAQGEIVSGIEAIAQMRAEAEEHQGAITAERAAADIAAYQETLFERIDRDAVGGMTGAAVYDLMFQNFSDEEVYELYNPYWSTLLKPWKAAGEEPAQTAARVTSEMAADWYGAADGLTQVALDDGQGGMWEYSEAERAYWTEMRSSVPEPIEYGYSGGWDNIVNCFAFLVFAILAVCAPRPTTRSRRPCSRSSTSRAPMPWCLPPGTGARAWWRQRSWRRWRTPPCTSRSARRSSWACRSRSTAPTASGCRSRAWRSPRPTRSR